MPGENEPGGDPASRQDSPRGNIVEDDAEVLGARDTVPDSVVERARTAFSRRGDDASLAVLVDEVIAQPQEGRPTRRLMFRRDTVTVAVDVVMGAVRSMVVHVLREGHEPATTDVRVALETEAGEVIWASRDADGSFTCGIATTGIVRLRVQDLVDEAGIRTDWFSI